MTCLTFTRIHTQTYSPHPFIFTLPTMSQEQLMAINISNLATSSLPKQVKPGLWDRFLDSTVILSFSQIGWWFRTTVRSKLPKDALNDKIAVVTGATSGIGLSASKQLASAGATVVLVGRNQEKLDKVCQELKTQVKGAKLDTALADFSSMAQVRSLSTDLTTRFPSIDILVNNAGNMFHERTVTDEGLEMSLATNLASHYVLTQGLHSALASGSGGRVINVSSGGMYGGVVDLADLNYTKNYGGVDAYARTKRGQLMLTQYWAKEWAGDNIVVHAMHPGWVTTAALKAQLPKFHFFMYPILRRTSGGSDTITWLAGSEQAGQTTGGFFLDRRARPFIRFGKAAASNHTPEAIESLVKQLNEMTSPK